VRHPNRNLCTPRTFGLGQNRLVVSRCRISRGLIVMASFKTFWPLFNIQTRSKVALSEVPDLSVRSNHSDIKK
jgi:hypothetical protein